MRELCHVKNIMVIFTVMADDFANFAEYREYIHREANLVMAHRRIPAWVVDRIERFVSEWLELCGQNETMHPIRMKAYHDEDYVRIFAHADLIKGACPSTYIVPLYILDLETAISCWIKITFAYKMALPVSNPGQCGVVLQIKQAFCDAWAVLQHQHDETRDIEFRTSPIGRYLVTSDYLIARDVTTRDETRDLLGPMAQAFANITPFVTVLWKVGTETRRRQQTGFAIATVTVNKIH